MRKEVFAKKPQQKPTYSAALITTSNQKMRSISLNKEFNEISKYTGSLKT